MLALRHYEQILIMVIVITVLVKKTLSYVHLRLHEHKLLHCVIRTVSYYLRYSTERKWRALGQQL